MARQDLDYIQRVQDRLRVARCYKRSDKPSGFMQGREFIEQLPFCTLLK
jgi:hypothetical protein